MAFHKNSFINKRIDLNSNLLSVVITIFVLIITFNSNILRTNTFLVTQLVLAIPLFLSSILFMITAEKSGKTIDVWLRYASTMFILGYAFLNSTVGILIATQISIGLAVVFFLFNWGLSLTYSFIKVNLKESTWVERIRKDALFIIIQALFGLLPAMGVY